MNNIWRIIFWGLICIICICLGVFGVIYNNKIFNEKKPTLENIVSSFNSNELLYEYKKINVNLNAELNKKDIVIKSTGNHSNEYTFTFKNTYLETKISKSDSFGEVVVMLVTGSISTIHGEEQNSINTLFNKDIYNYKLKDGIEFIDKTDSYIVKISLDNYLKNRTNN